MLRVIFSTILVLLSFNIAQSKERIVVFVPASLTEVLTKLADTYQTDHGQEVVLSIAGTAQLARQLASGAPAHIFISADKRWIDWAEKRGLIDPSSKLEFAGNRLVVAGRKESENWVDVEALLTEFPFAMGEPNSVPVGQYAREALVAKGWWAKAKQQAVFSENTRLTLRRLALGEVGAAMVYRTDVAVEPEVKTLLEFPKGTHSRISYWAAITTAKSTNSKRFLTYLKSPAAHAILTKFGFALPSADNDP